MLSEKDILELIEKALKEVKGESDSAANMEASDEPIDQEVEALPNDGRAWVENGKVYVLDPLPGGKQAAVAPGEGLELFINGEKVTGWREVLSTDRIEIRTLTQRKPGKYSLDVSADKMSAYLSIEPTIVQEYELIKCSPKNRLLIKVREKKISECPLTIDEVHKLLHEKNVNTGIDFSKIVQVIMSTEPVREVIAEGYRPEPSIDERVEILFKYDETYPAPLVKEDGTVDYLSIKNLICVDEGTLLAIKHPGKQGRPGLNVLGEVVPGQLPRRVKIIAGKGTSLSSDGNRLYATKSGRPVVIRSAQTYHIYVEDVFVYDKDVEASTGSVFFNGTLLVVSGNVKESASVKTTGMLAVNGVVSGATILAYDYIRIEGNTINSTVHAGIDENTLSLAYKCFRKAIRDIKK